MYQGSTKFSVRFDTPLFIWSVDEIIVNAADNFHRDKSMTMIKVTIDKDKGTIAVWNNGKGLPIQMH